MSYSKGNLSGKIKVPPKKAFIVNDPIMYEEAMSRSDAMHWKRACAEEMEEFVRQKIVGCKWVFKTKLDEEGWIEQYKARLVTQGFSQIPGVDFDETFAPVTCHQIFWILLALTNQCDWHVHQMDVKLAFLNGNLENEIFMKISPGAEAKPGEMWLLYKALYGLKQASRE